MIDLIGIAVLVFFVVCCIVAGALAQRSNHP